MTHRSAKLLLVIALLIVAMLASDPAYAFRCKNKLVRDGMHEQQVIAVCGEPTTMRHLGYTLRSFDVGHRSRYPGGWSTERRYPSYGIAQEVVVTEYVYNFGPRRLMRRLIFEGGVLATIETIGYGYIEK